jgi:hypothetical protein
MMHAKLATAAMRMAVAPLLIVTALPALAPTGASGGACATWTGVRPPDPGSANFDNVLYAVHLLSSSYAWAVGYYFNGIAARTLIEHWNGIAWNQVPGQNAAGPPPTTTSPA